MLDKVPAPELVVAAVANGVQPYAEEHDLPFDELLLQYIRVKKKKLHRWIGGQRAKISSLDHWFPSLICI